MKYDPPIIKPLKEIKWISMKLMKVMKGQKCLPLEGETRYRIVDEKLNDFLGELRVLQGWIIMALKEIWIHYKHKPTQEDRAWLEIIYGKKYRLKFFQDIQSRKKELKKIGKQKGCQISHVKSVIKNTISNVDFIYRNIRENYKDAHESYGIITEALLEEIIYPPFIKRVLEKFKVVLD